MNIPDTSAKGSLKSRNHQLSDSFLQLKVLNGGDTDRVRFPEFSERMKQASLWPLKPVALEIFQMNLGKMCNQTCRHCHVDAGPDRKEMMSRQTMERCLEILATNPVSTVDLTGGAPEMNPHFRWLVEQLRGLGKKIIVRCNLTIILANKKYHDLPDFFARHGVEVVSSLPFYQASRTDSQRGKGVFETSIKALHLLNQAGYGQEHSGLILNLVYNPAGAFLPASQPSLEAEFKHQLSNQYGIVFNQLYTITNMPISRFLDYLLESGNYEAYMQKLVTAFNPIAAKGVMCRNTLSIGWDGYLYDCDFNQMLQLGVESTAPQHINEFNPELLLLRSIVLNQHCYGCTAGAGSSCGGETA